MQPMEVYEIGVRDFSKSPELVFESQDAVRAFLTQGFQRDINPSFLVPGKVDYAGASLTQALLNPESPSSSEGLQGRPSFPLHRILISLRRIME